MGKKKTEEVAEAPPAADADDEEDTPVVKALKAIDDKYCAIEMEFEQEMEKLRKKYFAERQAPLLVERAQVLADAANGPAEDKEFGTPACKGFWLRAFQNADAFAECLEEWDEPVLEYLQDIKKSDLNDDLPQKGFKLEFLFKENPYFSNETLGLEFHIDYDPATYKPYLEPECIELKGSSIEWKAGKNVTVEVVTKKTKGGGAKKAKQKAKGGKEEPRESFFRLLFRNLKVGDSAPEDLAAMMGKGDDDDDDDDDDLIKMILEQLHSIGHEIAEAIIPYAVRFYTGEAGDKDDDDDEDSEEEDDDDDDDEDSDEEPPARSAKKKAQKKSGDSAEGGKKEEECKQQ